MEAAD
jgi:hypothetical protein